MRLSCKDVKPRAWFRAQGDAVTAATARAVCTRERRRTFRVCVLVTRVLLPLAFFLPLSAVSSAAAAAPEPPTMTVEGVHATEATLKGIVSPDATEPEQAGLYQFLYRPSSGGVCHGGSRAPLSPGIYFGGEHEELPGETITGLTPSTEYAVCLRVEDESGEVVSAPATFKTAEALPPTVESQSVSDETKGTAVVSTTIDPNGDATSCEIRFGKTEALEDVTGCPAELASRSVGQAVEISLTGLEPKTEYHYEVVATNEKGATQGTRGTFTTHPLISATTLPATSVRRANAYLNGNVNPEGVPTEYYYEYSLEPCPIGEGTCGMKTATRGPIKEEGEAEALKLTRLKPGSTYHYRLVASDAESISYGHEMTFTTATSEPKEYVFEKAVEGHAVESLLGIGINQATGSVYIGEYTSPMTIAQFNATGVWQSSAELPNGSGEAGVLDQLAVDNSTIPGQQGDVYVVNQLDGVVYKFDPNAQGELTPDPVTPRIPKEGEPLLVEPTGVAVGPSGDVYVETIDGAVLEFSPTGVMINTEVIKGPGGPAALALDANGNIYVAGPGGTTEYTSSGACAVPSVILSGECVKINEAFDEGVAVNAAGDVFVSELREGGQVLEYGPAEGGQYRPILNHELEKTGAFGFPHGLALDDASRALYVTDVGRNVVHDFRFLAAKPVIVKTEAATQGSGPVEILNGTVNPNSSEPAEYYFEYGPSPCDATAGTCGTVASEQSEVPLHGEQPVPVSVRLENLAPDTTYHYWVAGVNEESGIEHGEERTFTTGHSEAPADSVEAEISVPNVATPAGESGYSNLSSLAPTPGPKERGHATHTITRGQRLHKALHACRKDRRVGERKACEASAHRRYGPGHKAKKKK